MANVLRNPGLEAAQDGALIVVGNADAFGIEDDTPWTARAPGFWAGARFEVLSGSAVGQQGRVVDNQRPGSGRPDRLVLQPLPSGLQRGDVLALQGGIDATPAPLWWTQGAVLASTDSRPGSPGQRSICLLGAPGQPASLLHHLDSIGARAGKLLPVRGPWRLTLWARASGTSARLQLREHELHFAYSLPDFLALAAAVGARPWVVLPATSTPQDFTTAKTRGTAPKPRSTVPCMRVPSRCAKSWPAWPCVPRRWTSTRSTSTPPAAPPHPHSAMPCSCIQQRAPR